MNETLRSDSIGTSSEWLRLFPWLEFYAPGIGPHGSEFSSNPSELDWRDQSAFAGSASSRLVADRSDLSFTDLVPSLPGDIVLMHLSIGTRMANALTDHDMTDLDSIRHSTIEEVLEWSKVGVGSVQTLVSQLLISALKSHDAEREFGAKASQGWLRAVDRDLLEIANWNSLIGRPHSSLFERDTSISEPVTVQQARSRLSQISADDVLSGAPSGAATRISELIGVLSARQATVLRRRTFADDPMTLGSLGDLMDLTRERIRQIESKVVPQLQQSVNQDRIGELQSAIRQRVGSLVSLETLLSALPAARELVQTVNQPVWRVLDRLDDAYEIRDGWCATPNLEKQIERTRSYFSRMSIERGYVAAVEIQEMDELASLSDDESAEWFKYCQLVELEGYLIAGSAGIADRAALILNAEGDPMTAQQLLSRLGIDRSLGATKNALSVDDRFSRVNRDSWGLSSWGLSEYRSIRELIGNELERSSGELALSVLIDNITTRFDVNANSILTYATSHPYKLSNGIVRKITAHDAEAAGRSVWQTSRVYRRTDEWLLRTRLTTEHFRGSGSPLPSGLARALGVERGTSKAFESEQGQQFISWKSLQPILSSIRRLLVDFRPDEELFLVFSDSGSFQVERKRTGVNIVDEILSNVGRPAATGQPALGEVAESIGLGADVGLAGIISALRSRRDDEVAEMLEGI